MKDLIKILLWLLIVFAAAFLQTNRFLAWNGVNPNLLLLAVFSAVILEKKTLNILLLLIFSPGGLFFLFPFWFQETTILAGLGFLALFLKKFLTGNDLFDFLLLLFLGTCGFYSIAAPRFFLQPRVLAAESIYNLSCGLLIFLPIVFFYEKKTGIES